MVKLLFLQGCYGISDEELEFQVNDRISFRNFLNFPENIPDFSTTWRFREDLADKDTIDKVWAELHRQISEKNVQVKEGVIQDASFIMKLSRLYNTLRRESFILQKNSFFLKKKLFFQSSLN